MLSKSWCKSKTRRIRVFGEVVPISEVQFLETPKMKENNVKRSHSGQKWKTYAIKNVCTTRLGVQVIARLPQKAKINVS